MALVPDRFAAARSLSLSGEGELTRGRRVPAWVLSTLLHTAVMVALALTVRIGPAGTGGEPDRGVAVVLARAEQGKVEYFDEAALQRQTTSQADRLAEASSASPLPTAQELPLDAGGVLPSSDELIGAGQPGDALPSAADLTAGAAPQSSFGGQARTSVYGLQGEGTKFLYVFDRSGSMSGFEGRPLRSAQRELIASLNHLGETHQFQIIFYNHLPQVFRPDGRSPRMVFADEQGKTLAERFVRGIIASGGTEHMAPLVMALGMQPDVIFFLTDADEPVLSADELARLRRLNKGTQIHAIEFGFGPSTGEDNFLKRLARQNGGQHAYVDVSKLPK